MSLDYPTSRILIILGGQKHPLPFEHLELLLDVAAEKNHCETLPKETLLQKLGLICGEGYIQEQPSTSNHTVTTYRLTVKGRRAYASLIVPD